MVEQDHGGVIKEVGIFGLKTLLTLNSGAAIVLLAFVGNVRTKTETGILVNLFLLKWSMGFFLFGIFCVMISIVATYLLAQLSAMQHRHIARLSGASFLSLMVVPAIFAFLSFVAGFVIAILSITG